MKNNRRTGARDIIIPMVFAICLGITTGCSPSAMITVGGIHINGYKTGNNGMMRAGLIVPFSNQTKFPLKIKKYVFTIKADENIIGEVTGRKKTVIAAMSDSVYVFPVEISFHQVLSGGIKTVFHFLKTGGTEIMISGKITGCAGIFPFRRTFRQKTSPRIINTS